MMWMPSTKIASLLLMQLISADAFTHFAFAERLLLERQTLRDRIRESLSLAPSPFAVAQSFSPRSFNAIAAPVLREFEECNPEPRATAKSRVTIIIPTCAAASEAVINAANKHADIAISLVHTDSLHLVAYGSRGTLQAYVHGLRMLLRRDSQVSITWEHSSS